MIIDRNHKKLEISPEKDKSKIILFSANNQFNFAKSLIYVYCESIENEPIQAIDPALETGNQKKYNSISLDIDKDCNKIIILIKSQTEEYLESISYHLE